MPTRFQTIIFDFDYTLADSSRGVAECINFALAELNVPQILAEATHHTIALHLDDAFIHLAGKQHAAQRDELKRHFAQRAE